MKIFILGIFAAIALWFRSAFAATEGVGIKSPLGESEDSPSMFSDDSSVATSFNEDSPARGMWDVTSIYYSMMHSDDLHSTSISSGDSWSSSSSSSMFDDSLSSSSSFSSFDD